MAAALLSMTGDEAQQRAQTRTIVLALLVSLALHVFVLSFQLDRPAPEERLLTVNLIQPTPSKKRQIVSPSHAPESSVSPQTPRLSDRNTVVEKETVRRGLPSKQVASPQTEAISERPPEKSPVKQATKPEPSTSNKAQKAQPKPQQTAKAELPKRPSLKLSDKRVLSTVGTVPIPSPSSDTKTINEQIEELRSSQTTESARPFRKFSSQGAFLGPDGVPDHLPEIPDGDITMLNAKAFKFAVFVRRVAYKVFGEFRQRSWESLPAGEIMRTRGSVMVRATLNSKGELISTELIDSSGSKAFDGVLNGAAKAGAWDHNPPPGAAAEDGNIHFLFEAKTWVRRSPDGVRQQRWILLGTALL